MGSFVANAVAVAHAAAEQLAGEPAKYRVDGTDIPITVMPGRRTSTDYGEDGAAVLATLHDWLINPEELVIGNVPVIPAPEHRIVLESGGTYAVTYDGQENCWRWNDQLSSA